MTIIKNRRGTASQWTTANPVLAEGEIGFETDTGKHKIGNGVSAWLGLHYFVNDSDISASIAAVVTPVDQATQIAEKRGATWFSQVTALVATADVPTITAAMSAQISGTNTVAPSTDMVYDSHFRYDGTLTLAVPSAGYINSTWTPGLIFPEFTTDDANTEFEVLIRSTGTTFTIRVEVDGKPHSLNAQSFTVTNATNYWVRVTFPTARARKIKLFMTGHNWFGGVKLAAAQTVTRPGQEVKRRLAIIADSYLAGGPGVYPNNGNRIETFGYWLYKLFECDSYLNMGISGTGWVNDNTTSQAYLSRVPDLLTAKPHIALLVGSRNDIAVGIDQTQVYVNALAGLTQVSDLPLVYAFSPETASSTLDTVTAGIKAAAGKAGRKFFDIRGTETATSGGHPTFANQLTIAQAIYALLDRSHIDSVMAGTVAGRTGVTVTLTASPNNATWVGNTVTLTATLNSSQSGQVTFFDAGVAIGTDTVTGGVATLATSALALGSHTFTARFEPTDPLTVKRATSAALAYTISANTGFTDSFTRSDGAIGSTVNGKAWSTSGSGSWVVASNKAANPTASGNSYAFVDAGLSDGTFTFTVGGTLTAGGGIDVMRYSDGSNHLFLNLNGTGGRLRLFKKIANVSTAITTGANGTVVAAGDVISVVFSGSTITVKQNGTTIDTVTEAQWSTQTKFGLYVSSGATGITWDDASFV